MTATIGPAKQAGHVPDAPGRLPLLGHGHAMLRRPLDFLTSLAAQGPLVCVRLGKLPVYVINDAGLARAVLTGEAGVFHQGILVEKARPLLGEGVGMLNGERHRWHRRMMQPAFHTARIAGYAEVMSRLAAERAAAWRPGQVLSLDQEMNELALTTIAATLFSADFTAAAEAIKRSLPVVLAEIPRRAVTPDLLLKLPGRRNRRFAAAAARLHEITRQAVAASRAAGTDRGDLVSTLVCTIDPATGGGLTDTQIHDQLINMMVAGTETTGAAMAWAFYELARNPLAQRKLHEETDLVLGGRAARFTDIPRLSYTRRVVLETLRLYPPYIIVRHAPAAVTIGGFPLPADASILFSPYVLHRSEPPFPQPSRFDPDRWLPGRDAQLPKSAFIPFGAGRRQCPGNHFALTEMVIHLATIAARWRLQPVPGSHVNKVARGAVIHPDALVMTAIPRTGAGRSGPPGQWRTRTEAFRKEPE
jgi:cytochrome P450